MFNVPEEKQTDFIEELRASARRRFQNYQRIRQDQSSNDNVFQFRTGPKTYDRVPQQHKRNVRFLHSHWRRKPNGRRQHQRRGMIKKKKRQRPSRNELYHIARLFHEHPNKTITQIKNLDKVTRITNPAYEHIYYGSHRANQRWRVKYAKDTKDWKDLCTLINVRGYSKSKKLKTIHLKKWDDFKGFTPIVEEYLMHLRDVKASKSESRSIKWLRMRATQLFHQPKILDLLATRWTQREEDTIARFQRKGFTKNWLHKMKVMIVYDCCVF